MEQFFGNPSKLNLEKKSAFGDVFEHMEWLCAQKHQAQIIVVSQQLEFYV